MSLEPRPLLPKAPRLRLGAAGHRLAVAVAMLLMLLLGFAAPLPVLSQPADNGDSTAPASAAEPDSTPPRAAPDFEPMVVATRHVPPFAIRNADGEWTGIAIELWDGIAEQLGIEFDYRDMGLAEMLDAVASGGADAAVAALTITPEREAYLDFSHPFVTSGLGVAVHQRPKGGAMSVLKRLVSAPFLGVLAALLGLLTVTGALIWLAERRHNEHFQRHALRGIGSGVWWSAVTMTTVGYGDKAPQTLAGRVIGLVWMFAGIIMISGFTAAITTALTVGELNQSIKRLDDLYSLSVATVAGSTSDRFLTRHGIRHEALPSPEEALAQLAEKKIDAVVYDAPILRWMIAEEYSDKLRVLPLVLQRQDYGIALPQGSPAREHINTLLLETLRDDDWQGLLERHLGQAR